MDDRGPLRRRTEDAVPLTTTIVLAVAAATGRSPEELAPLHDAVDCDALADLQSSDGPQLVVSFVYEGVDVTVRPDEVEVRQLEA